MIRIGILAQKTNLSKRTLRYYEQIGLLKPSAIEANGYRYYDESAVVRLHRQIELMEQQKEELSRKQYYLRSAIDILRLRGVNGMNDLLGVIEGLNGRPLVDGVVAAEFGDELPVTPMQKAILQRLPVWGSGDERLEPLLALFRQAAEMMSSSPYSAEAQALAGRIDAVSAEMFEGDRQLLDLYWEWMKPTTGEEPAVIGFDSGLTDYVDQMMAFYYEQKESEKDEKT